MKPKNISTIELHVEKVVLGLVAVFLLWVLWAYVIQSRYSIELGGQSVAPGQVDRKIREEAQVLEDRLRGPAPRQISELDIPRYARLFQDELSGPTTPESTRPGIGASRLAARLSSRPLPLDLAEGPGPDLERPIRTLQVPAPTALAASTYLGTLAAEQLEVQVLEKLPTEDPFDLQWVTVAGRFPVDRLREHLDSDPPQDMRPIPRSWLEQTLAVADVQLQRRRLMPDGSWSDPEPAERMPGRPVLGGLVGEPTAMQIDQAVQTIRREESRLLQPPFYPLRHGRWSPPQIEATTAEADAAEDTGRAAATGRARPTAGPASPDDAERSRLPLPDEPMVVWNHDVFAEPGATYQYRLRVVMINPLFGRDLPNQPAQAERFTVAGDWSDWSEPVETYRRQYFFLTSANANLGRATVEAWKFHNGLWRMANFPIAPGDPVGQATSNYRPLFPDAVVDAGDGDGTVDFSTGYLAVDIDFSYKVPGPLGTQTTSRMLVSQGGDLRARIQAEDSNRSDDLREQLLASVVIEEAPATQPEPTYDGRDQDQQRRPTRPRGDERTPQYSF